MSSALSHRATRRLSATTPFGWDTTSRRRSGARGYATEAVQAVVDGVFLLTGTKAIVADARVVNPASSRVLQKCGFAFQGSNLVDLAARGGFFPVDTFRLDRKVWASLKGWATPDLVGRDAAGENAPRRPGWSEPVALT